jgi:hypothetical protein
VNPVSFVRKHGLLLFVIVELVTAAALAGWLLAGLILS